MCYLLHYFHFFFFGGGGGGVPIYIKLFATKEDLMEFIFYQLFHSMSPSYGGGRGDGYLLIMATSRGRFTFVEMPPPGMIWSTLFYKI